MKTREATPKELSDLLSRHRLLGDAPASELAWLAEHGELRTLQVGDLVTARGRPVTELLIVLDGKLGMYLERTGTRRVMLWQGGDVTGLLPYSRLDRSPGEGRAEEPTTLIAVHANHFPELIRECPVVTTTLVQQMLDRARYFTQYDLHDEKMKSLGRLAAGLAHEMDNPAAAVIRGAKLLVALLDEADAAARDLGSAGIDDARMDAIKALRNRCQTTPVEHVRSPLEQVRHEEAITEWMEAAGVEVQGVEALAESPVTVGMLETLADSVDREHLEPALRWVAAGCAVRALAAELNEAAAGISHLVKAVKGFTQMDSAATPQEIDVGKGLTQTLAVHRSKAKAKAVRVTIRTDEALPPVRGVPGELNQVWANLLDNALDAVDTGGSVEITARREGDRVVVRIVDNGAGIPAHNLDRIFEPFFTTKAVGAGTGLGLDIVRRLVNGNDGEIEVSSEPGRTEFRVYLPVMKTPHRTAPDS